ncbi:hypothetical protein ACOSQ2_010174 [Xanthoceras sorbifolium]
MLGVGNLCFPSLITYFCAVAEVDVYGRDEIVIPPSLNLDRRTYKDLARGRREPEFDSRFRVRPQIDEEDVVARGPDPTVDQPIPPAWAAAMFNSLERRPDGLKGDINDKFDNLIARMGVMEETLGAIKLGQVSKYH